MSRAEWEKEDYKNNVRRLLDKPIRNYRDTLLMLSYLNAVSFVCRLYNWNINEILGDDSDTGLHVDLHKEIYTILTQRFMAQLVDSKDKVIIADRRLKQIEHDCKMYGWNIIEILGGEPDAGKNNTETQNFRYAPVHV